MVEAKKVSVETQQETPNAVSFGTMAFSWKFCPTILSSNDSYIFLGQWFLIIFGL